MDEGLVYLCNCSETNGVFFLELQANNKITFQGDSLQECMDEICTQIIDWNGDGEAILELFPPFNKKGLSGSALFRSASYNDSVNIIKGSSVYENGICQNCKHGLGARNKFPLELSSKPKGLVVGVLGCFPNLLIYSKKIIGLLTDEEKKSFNVRPVFFNGIETDYLEAFPNEVISQVGHRKASYPTTFQQSWRCNFCNRESFFAEVNEYKNGSTFIDPKDLMGKIPSIIFVDTGMSVSIAFSNERWTNLLKNKILKGLLSDDVIVLDPEYIEMPTLVEPKEFDWIL